MSQNSTLSDTDNSAPTPRHVTQRKPIILALIAVAAMFAGFAGLMLLIPFGPNGIGDLSVTSSLGESFGILNTLFSGLAFAILIGTLIYQRSDIEASRKNLEMALHYQAQQASAAQQQLEENTRQLQANLFAMAELEFVHLERSMADCPKALRFYGVTDAELDEIGVTAPEFALVLSMFTAGGIDIKAQAVSSPNTVSNDPFTPGSYFHKFLMSPDVRQVWTLVERSVAESVYKRKIDATIRDIDASTIGRN